MSPYFYLFDAIENTIATLKEWQERLVEQRKSNMELENLILYLIKVEQTAEEWDFGAEQRRFIQIIQKSSKFCRNIGLTNWGWYGIIIKLSHEERRR